MLIIKISFLRSPTTENETFPLCCGKIICSSTVCLSISISLSASAFVSSPGIQRTHFHCVEYIHTLAAFFHAAVQRYQLWAAISILSTLHTGKHTSPGEKNPQSRPVARPAPMVRYILPRRPFATYSEGEDSVPPICQPCIRASLLSRAGC